MSNWIDDEALRAGWVPEGKFPDSGAAIVVHTIARRQVHRAKEALDIITDAERADLFAEYCIHCGSKDPKCQCANDE